MHCYWLNHHKKCYLNLNYQDLNLIHILCCVPKPIKSEVNELNQCDSYCHFWPEVTLQALWIDKKRCFIVQKLSIFKWISTIWVWSECLVFLPNSVQIDSKMRNLWFLFRLIFLLSSCHLFKVKTSLFGWKHYHSSLKWWFFHPIPLFEWKKGVI